MTTGRCDGLALELDGLELVFGWIMHVVEGRGKAFVDHIIGGVGWNRGVLSVDLEGVVSLLLDENHVIGCDGLDEILLGDFVVLVLLGCIITLDAAVRCSLESLVGCSPEA
jgi:hypothetical protein